MIEDIVDGMLDWVRVLDLDCKVIFMNKAMTDGLGSHVLGKKCYQLLGRTEACENCTSRSSSLDGLCHEKEEVINGRIFSIMSSPIKDADGNVTAVVEVLRETTELKQLTQDLQMQNYRFKAELDMARNLQASLLPEPLTDNRIAFSYIYLPCEAIGGDFIDMFRIDESHLGIYIADVSGHGVPASLLTVFLRSSLNKRHLSPAKALEDLFREFNESKLDSHLYITVFYAVIDLYDKTMLYSNAGLSVSPLIYNADRFLLLRIPGIPISNWLDKPHYLDRSVQLRSGDRLLLYSDGILEMKNHKNERFGEERLLKLILNSTETPQQLLKSIQTSAFRFAGIQKENELQDDLTLAILELI